MSDLVSFGPWGGPEGEGLSWDYKPDGSITEMVIQHGIVIDSLVFKSKRFDGMVTTSKKFGGGGGNAFTVTFKPGEIITGVEVMLGDFQGHSVVHNLCIITNKTKYGPFGTERGTRTSIPIKDGEVVGFFGRSAAYLNAIGFYAVGSNNHLQDNKVNKAMSVGPWGSSEGTPWTYLSPGTISKIVITHGGCIDSLIFDCKGSDGVVTCSQQYGGTSSAKYGGPGGHTTDEVVISSNNYITGIDMMVGKYDENNVINQLTIHTKLKTYGPFGTATGSKFSIPIKDGSVVGFFGRSGLYLNAIGIFVKKIPSQEDKDDKTVVKPDPTIVKPDPTVGPGGSCGGSDGGLAIGKFFLNININVKLNSGD